MPSWAPPWFDTQWSTVDGHRHVDLSGNETLGSKLGDKRWKRDTIIARGNELCNLDISTFDNADLATLYKHAIDVDETLLHIKDDWPIERFMENDQLIIASHISKEQIASDETQALIAKRLTERHDRIRAIINKRPLDRKLSLNDLPTEIINKIIDHCEDNSNLVDNPEYVAAEYEVAQEELNTIKSLRLTCHKLNELASPRLMPSITVSPTEESLTRLENVSKHGVFGKAIKRVRLVMGHYSHVCAQTPASFSSYAITTIQWAIEARNTEEFNFPPVVDILSTRDKEKLFRLQRRLDEVSEGFDSRKYADAGRAMSRESLIELLTAPMEWNRMAGSRAGGNLSVDALGKLLPALGKLGVRLKVFEMDVTPPVSFKMLFMRTEEVRLQTRELLRDVWFLRLCIKARSSIVVTDEDGISRSWGRRMNIEISALHGFVNTLLQSPRSLEWLQLNFESLAREGNTRGWFAQPVMTSRKASHPCRMDLLHVSLDSETMDTFLGDGPLFLTLGAPVIKNGTWMEALRIMRQKFKHDDLSLGMRRQSSFPSCMRGLRGLVVGGIQYADGAECREMDEGDYSDVFGEWGGLGDDSHAMDYIHHERDDDPLSGYN
ncbi:hypothetical protein CcaCcLH18_05601 [Colletotrichum camelliae]|nr:hypothetical protein CcaCcLH18_05601 [Colletotrichum camelliae]